MCSLVFSIFETRSRSIFHEFLTFKLLNFFDFPTLPWCSSFQLMSPLTFLITCRNYFPHFDTKYFLRFSSPIPIFLSSYTTTCYHCVPYQIFVIIFSNNLLLSHEKSIIFLYTIPVLIGQDSNSVINPYEDVSVGKLSIAFSCIYVNCYNNI